MKADAAARPVSTVQDLPVTEKANSAPSTAALVAAARRGEAWARDALFRRHLRLANGLAYKLLGSDQELDDVVQAAMIQAIESLHRLKDPEAFSSWLCGIVVHTVRRTLTRRRMLSRLGLRAPLELDAQPLLAPTVPPDVAAELREVYAVLQQLSVSERLVLVLRRVEGRTLPEIAGLCQIGLTTVKRRLAKAEAKLTMHREGKHETA